MLLPVTAGFVAGALFTAVFIAVHDTWAVCKDPKGYVWRCIHLAAKAQKLRDLITEKKHSL